MKTICLIRHQSALSQWAGGGGGVDGLAGLCRSKGLMGGGGGAFHRPTGGGIRGRGVAIACFSRAVGSMMTERSLGI